MGLGGLLGCLCPSLAARARGRLDNFGDLHPDSRNACTSLEKINIELFIRQPKQADVELLAYLVLARDDADVADGSAAGEVFSVAFASGSLLNHLGCSSRQEYLSRLGAWLAADGELADQFARLVRCATHGCPGMLVYPLEDGVQLHDGVYNISLTVKACLIVDAAGVLSSEGSGPGRPALAVSHKLSRLDDLSAMRQQEMALTTIPAIVTALLLDGRVVYQNPRSQQYMGNLVSSYLPAPGTSLTSLGASTHPLKRLFRFDPEALQAFEAAMATETEFRRVIKVPKRIKQPQQGGGGRGAAGGGAGGQLSPGRRARVATARERPGGSRLIRQASSLAVLQPNGTGDGTAMAAGLGGGGSVLALGQDAGGGYGRNGSMRGGRSGLVSRAASMSRTSPVGSGRAGLAGTSRRGMLSAAASTAASRRSSSLMAQHGGVVGAGVQSATPGSAGAAAAAASGTGRRNVRRCTSVMNLGPRAGLASPGTSSRPGLSQVVSRTPSFLGAGTAGGAGVPGRLLQLQQRRPLLQLQPLTGTNSPQRQALPSMKPATVAAASLVQMACVADSPVGSGAAGPGRPGGAVTWTAGLPLLTSQGSGGSGIAAAGLNGAPSVEHTLASTGEVLCDLPSGVQLQAPQAERSSHPSVGGDDGSDTMCSNRQSVSCANRNPKQGRRLLAPASPLPIHQTQDAPAPGTGPPAHQQQQFGVQHQSQEQSMPSAGGSGLANGGGGGPPAPRSARSFAQLNTEDSDPSSRKLLQVSRSARSFAAYGTSSGAVSPMRPNLSHPNRSYHTSRRGSSSSSHNLVNPTAMDVYRPVDSGASLGLGFGMALATTDVSADEGAHERISIVSSTRSSRAGRRGSFIVLGALAASASAFRRSASADPAGLTGSGASSRKGTGTGMMHAMTTATSSGASSNNTSPRNSAAAGRGVGGGGGGGGAAAASSIYHSRSEHLSLNVHPPDPHSASAAMAMGRRPRPLAAAAGFSMVEVAPMFMDANGQEVEAVADVDAAAAALRQYASAAGSAGSSARGGQRPSGSHRGASAVPPAQRDALAAGSAGMGAPGSLMACVSSLVGPPAGVSGPSFRNSVNLLSSIQEEGGEVRCSKEDNGGLPLAVAAAGLPMEALPSEASWSTGSNVRQPGDCGGTAAPYGGGTRSGAASMLLMYGEPEGPGELQAEGASIMLAHLNNSSGGGGGVERLTSSHHQPLPSLNLGMASGAIETEDLTYVSGGGGGHGSGVFRGFGVALAGMARGEGQPAQVSGSLSVQLRLGAARVAAAGGGSGSAAPSVATGTSAPPARGPAATAPDTAGRSAAPPVSGSSPTFGSGANAGARTVLTARPAGADAAGGATEAAGMAGGVWQEGPSPREHPAHSKQHQHHQHQPEAAEQSGAAASQLSATQPALLVDAPVSRPSHGSLQLPYATAATGALKPSASVAGASSSQHPPSDAAAVASQDTTASSSQLVKASATSPCILPFAAAPGELHGIAMSEFGLSSGGILDVVGTMQLHGPGRGTATTNTLTDMEQYLISPSPTAGQGNLFPAHHGGAADGGAGVADGGCGDVHRTWAAGDNVTVVSAAAAAATVGGSFSVERSAPDVASALTGPVTCPVAGSYGCRGGGGTVGGSSGPTRTGTGSLVALTSGTGMTPQRAPPLRRRNTKDRLMSLLTSLSRDDSDEDEPGDEHEWHDVYACVRVEGASGRPVAVITQTEVTEQVEVQRKLEALLEHEHKVLESIFPRHVIEHMTLQAKHRGTVAGGGGCGALGSSWANFRGSAMEALATSHSCVTILFCDIIGFTEMCKEVSAMVVMRFLNTLYMKFDELIDIYGVYKVETIGDCYMVAGGLVRTDVEGNKSVIGDGSEDALHAVRVMSFAKAIMREAAEVVLPTSGEPVQLRVGLHSGPVMSGIVGDKMPRFCLFGDTVNTASRMESTCPPGAIHVSADTRALLHNEAWVATGGVQVKGKGLLETYVWAGHAAEEDEDAERRLKVYL